MSISLNKISDLTDNEIGVIIKMQNKKQLDELTGNDLHPIILNT